MKIAWYWHRFRVMSLNEIIYRFQQMCQKVIEKNLLFKNIPTAQLSEMPIPLLGIHKTSSFNEIFKSELYPIFDKTLNLFNEIDWHLDLKTEKRFPMIFGKSICIRSEKFGNAKYVWEVNRMQFLILIALQYKLNRDVTLLNKFETILDSWELNNPYLLGVNWHSNIEVNIRLIVWFMCWEILDVNQLMQNNHSFANFVVEKWIHMIYQHCLFSYRNPSKFSSANNHLIAEASGLFIASSFWRFKESEKWCRYSKRILEQEIVKQHSESGINKEQASEYIQFVTDFFLLAYVVADRTNNPFSNDFKVRMHRIFKYVEVLLDTRGEIPRYGDGDDGFVFFNSFQSKGNNYKSLMISALVLWGNSIFKKFMYEYDLKNLILFGEQGKRIYQNINVSKKQRASTFFPGDGHFIFRKNNLSKEIYLHFIVACVRCLNFLNLRID